MSAQQPAPAGADASGAKPSRTGASLGFGMPSADGRVMLGQDIEIFQDRPREDLASYGTFAFEAKDRRMQGTQFALICDRSLQPRMTNIGTYKNFRNPHALKLVDAGIVYWPAEGKQMLALVYEMPPARRLMAPNDPAPIKIADDRIIPSVIRPIISILNDLDAADMVHGAIVPENIYISGAEGLEEAVLGECLSSAPFMRHHALYETVERGMAQPGGRGQGTRENDLYSLGMCVATIVRGVNMTLHRSPDKIIRDKLEHGTYSSCASREKVPGPISEFLRGVLNDDETQRWTLVDVNRWLEGRSPGSKQSQSIMKAARPFIFRDQKFWDVRSLAYEFGLHVGEAVSEVEKDHFTLWLKRNFDDKDMEKRLERLRDKEDSSTSDKLAANACMALDPQGPLRYRGLSLMPAGFGTAMASAAALGQDLQPYGELLAMQFMSTYIQQRFDHIADATGYLTQFEKARNFLMQKMPGYGIERAVYLLNKEAVCMSPSLDRYFVFTLGHLLQALDALARQQGRPESILDRHMIAFISVREGKMIDPHLGHIVSRDKIYQLIGMLRTLAAIQRRFQVGSVPALGNWIVSLLGPVIDRYNDRDLRQEVSRRLNSMPDPGNLSSILELVDSEGTIQNDTQKFIAARQEFAMLLREALMIGAGLKKRKHFGLDAGRQTAMIISAVISTFSIASFILFHLMSK